MRLVLIEWIDSYGCSAAWQQLSDCAPQPMICRSVGWLLHDGAECKVIVPHVADQAGDIPTQGCGDMTIPAVTIRRILDLPIPEPVSN